MRRKSVRSDFSLNSHFARVCLRSGRRKRLTVLSVEDQNARPATNCTLRHRSNPRDRKCVRSCYGAACRFRAAQDVRGMSRGLSPTSREQVREWRLPRPWPHRAAACNRKGVVLIGKEANQVGPSGEPDPILSAVEGFTSN
jgi:hypothetical protein